MSGLDIRELECFLVLAEELHFGRTGERLYLTQGRVSQLVRSLEQRVGARLVERTSRRVRLTPLGEQFLAGLRPAYDGLRAVLDTTRAAARGVEGSLRLGFQCTANDHLMNAVALFQERYPRCAVEMTEVPLSDPFGPLRRGEVDLAAVLMPIAEEDLVVGAVFSRGQQTLAVSSRHPFARRSSVSAEELGDCVLIGVRSAAPRYWRATLAPTTTPAGRPIPAGPTMDTLQEGLTLAAANRGALLLCQPTAEYHRRHALTFVPVTGLPDSELGLTWCRDHETARVRAFAQVLSEVAEPTADALSA
ncbi:transcriptional regulator, LysR family [Streptoalloteichus tenebrarius]|uniref:Transcriptional regulator, LysR family n=1 Tax=Streptoalloteichus tenebrarius (strain ATCC 17920 / DSM 40477 / JCM 4838 / CBS 697.72 / NBRC 16177 / NCIMB 11028 / NRRL B-12390 / A12253. 1 / ISP 5477) TaxID=1933 RepID=A0ABT1HQ30_STRSD|nr:LysR family transcriptional regulator [Streptoalloteichus tenebrarius]MCP2257570.1 transcriptional regulator, LysR family [Streptoalloteichus tenebrarius]BFE98524.1 LysR family transcriptional regulator [Streptoalloteichus tenebrarius]